MKSRLLLLAIMLLALAPPVIQAYDFELIHHRPMTDAALFDDLDPVIDTGGTLVGFLYTEYDSRRVILDLLSDDSLREAIVDGRLLGTACVMLGDTVRAFVIYNGWSEQYPHAAIVDFTPDGTNIDSLSLGISGSDQFMSWYLNALDVRVGEVLNRQRALIMSLDFSQKLQPPYVPPSLALYDESSLTSVFSLNLEDKLWSAYVGQIATGELAPAEGLEFVSFLNYLSEHGTYSEDPLYSRSAGTMVGFTTTQLDELCRCSSQDLYSWGIQAGDLVADYDGDEFLYCGQCSDLASEGCGTSFLACCRYDGDSIVTEWCHAAVRAPDYVYDSLHVAVLSSNKGLVEFVDGATGALTNSSYLSSPITQRVFFEADSGRLHLLGRSADTIMVFRLSIATDVTDDWTEPLPDDFTLSQNYPNPFNPATTIEFALPRRSRVSIVIYNVVGQQVTSLVDRVMPAGLHSVAWDGTDANGSPVSSGVYLYRLVIDDFSRTRKMVLLR